MEEYDNDEEETMHINDHRVPVEIREHAARFRTPVHYVSIVGNDILLLAEDGELIDICALAG